MLMTLLLSPIHRQSSQKPYKSLSDEALKIGLSINWQKTKVMFVEPCNSPCPPPVLMVGDKPAEIVEEFAYLGSILSNDRSIL